MFNDIMDYDELVRLREENEVLKNEIYNLQRDKDDMKADFETVKRIAHHAIEDKKKLRKKVADLKQALKNKEKFV